MKSIRIFIASPGDVTEEREVLSGIVIPELRRIFSNHEMVGNRNAISIDAIRWETHAWPAVGDDAQDVINREIGEYDILVGMMWKRFGTPTKRAQSGTGEEFERAYQYYETYKRPNIMFYFRTTPFYTTGDAELKQFQKVVQFRKKLEKLGVLFWEFTSPIQFERDVREHLIRQIAQILRAGSPRASNLEGRTAEPKPSKPRVKDKPVEVFLMYGREDLELVRSIYASLREAGFEPWMDTEQLVPGQRWHQEIERAISRADAILILLSKHSVAKRGFLQVEIRSAMQRAMSQADRPFLIPVRLEPTDMPEFLGELQWVDYFAEGGPERLMQALYSMQEADLEAGRPQKKSKSNRRRSSKRVQPSSRT